MRKPTVKPGDVVAIRFDDHVEDSDDVYEFIVYGRVAKVSRKAITVDSWALADPDSDRDDDRENIKSFTILRRVINSIEVLAVRGEAQSA